MNRTKIICLANSAKHKERCVAGIDVDLGCWIRPVSPDYPEDGRVPWKTLIYQDTKILNLADIKPLDILEIPLNGAGPDFGFECENFTIAPGEWHLIGQASIDQISPSINFKSPILHNNQKYVSVSSLQALPFQNRRSLELVYTDFLTITQQPRVGGGIKWKGSFKTRGGYFFNEITITDTESFELLAMGIYPTQPCLLVMSLGMPYTPPGWNGPANPCWKLIAGIIELSLADQILTEMHYLGWTTQQGREYAAATYGKRSRSQLTDDEKRSFINYLRQMSPESP